jgi:hypothetical protein
MALQDRGQVSRQLRGIPVRASGPHRDFTRHWVNRAAPLVIVAVGRALDISVAAYAHAGYERPDHGTSRHPTLGPFPPCVGFRKSDPTEVTKSSGARRHVYERLSTAIEPECIPVGMGGNGPSGESR